MSTEILEIGKITIAVTNTEQMVAFYKNVYKCELKEFDVNGTTLYSGQIAGVKILLCPNSLAGVKAEQNRHQFDYIVKDLDRLVSFALASGGALQGKVEVIRDQKTATIVDPDGNTTVLIQKL